MGDLFIPIAVFFSMLAFSFYSILLSSLSNATTEKPQDHSSTTAQVQSSKKEIREKICVVTEYFKMDCDNISKEEIGEDDGRGKITENPELLYTDSSTAENKDEGKTAFSVRIFDKSGNPEYYRFIIEWDTRKSPKGYKIIEYGDGVKKISEKEASKYRLVADESTKL